MVKLFLGGSPNHGPLQVHVTCIMVPPLAGDIEDGVSCTSLYTLLVLSNHNLSHDGCI
jgi:hypothetical protein